MSSELLRVSQEKACHECYCFAADGQASRVPGCRNPAIISYQFSAVPPTEPGLLENVRLLLLANASIEARSFQLCSGEPQQFESSYNSHPKGSPLLSPTEVPIRNPMNCEIQSQGCAAVRLSDP